MAAPPAKAFEVVSNRPFAARCNGPMGAIVVRESAVMPMSAAARDQRRQAAVQTQHNILALSRAERPVRLLAARGVLRGPARVSFPRVMVHVTEDDRIILPDLVRAQQTGTPLGQESNELRFHFEGFDEAQEAALRDYLDTAVGVARRIYGPPAFDLDVKIINDPNVHDLQGGYYDVTANEIHLAPASGNFAEDTFVLIKLVLHAFHDDAIFFFDAWEEGFAGAAAMAVQTTPGVAPGYNPYDPGPFYCLSVYECENQPALAGPTFYPKSGFTGMLVWRIAMARAAWFKCYIEDPEFFRKFNQEYYRRYTPALAGDTYGLKEIAASVLPQVEGMSFYEWYHRQYVLDTSIHVGPKLFTWNIPLKESVALIVEYFSTDGSGDETPLGGQAVTVYWSYDFSVSLYAEEGNVISVPASGEGAGEGFLIPTFFNIGGPQRITVQIDIGDLRGYYPYPYGVRGFEPGENNIYGGILDAVSGSVDITGAADASDIEVSRGVWGTEIMGGHLAPAQVTVTYKTSEGAPASRTVNIGWDSYVLFIRGGAHVTVTHHFPAGVHLMSLPVYVLTPSAPDVLGVPAGQLLMARWYPRLDGTGRYRLWPDVEGFAPGKAFWLKLFDPIDVSVEGIPPDPDIDFPVTLRFGWNMVGVPRQAAVQVADLRCQVGTDPSITFDEAVERHWVQKTVFGYTMARGYEEVDELRPFAGYWVRCLVSTELRLLFPPASGSSAQARAPGIRKAETSGRLRTTSTARCDLVAGWAVRLVARSRSDAANAVIASVPSLARGASIATVPAPPPGPTGLRLAVVRAAGRKLDEPAWRAEACRAVGRWRLSLTGPPGERVTISAEPLTRAAGACREPSLTLRLPDGRAVALSACDAAVTVPVSGRVELDLDVRERALAAGPLLASVTAQRWARVAAIVYTLGREAAVEVSVLNIAGRTVRRLSAGAVQPAGRHQLTWNLTNDFGAPAPPGMYLVRLAARAPDGTSQRAVVPLRLTR